MGKRRQHLLDLRKIAAKMRQRGDTRQALRVYAKVLGETFPQNGKTPVYAVG